MKKIAFLAPIICLAVLSVSAKADNILKFNGSNSEIGPYSLTLNNTTNLSLFCLDDQRYINDGESWQVNIINGANLASTFSSNLAKEYEEEALILSKLGGQYSNTDVQDAIWNIFDPSADDTNDSKALVNYAKNNVGSVTSAFLSGYTFYIPTGSEIRNRDGHDLPQDFIGKAAPALAPTPEPSTLALFGSGLIGMAGAIRRKLRT